MDNQSISIFGNKIFLEIIKEIKLFSKFKIKYYENFDQCIIESKDLDQPAIFFIKETNKTYYNKIEETKIPSIIISNSYVQKKMLSEKFIEKINTPFSILELKKKIILILAKYEYKKNSLIYLKNYIIDKNERKIKKDNLELQLSEKEINFLILFSKSKEPISRNFVLKKVWNYSSDSDTHTVETHIHRLRKKILQKFGDNNFIKNNNKGYYI